jgi:hypothetical protein
LPTREPATTSIVDPALSICFAGGYPVRSQMQSFRILLKSNRQPISTDRLHKVGMIE